MANQQHRKYLLTFNNPEEHGFTRDVIASTLASMNVTYYCIADEIGASGTRHTHVFLYRKGAIRESTIRRKFPAVHFDYCIGTCRQNREYVSKTGKWAADDKAKTSVQGSFEEFGELPDERQEKDPEMSDIISEVEAGKTTASIIKDNPRFLFRSNDINVLRETLTEDEFLSRNRDVKVFYFYGPTAAGKTKSIFEDNKAADICRVTNYGSPNTGIRFDGYHNHKVLVFEEFASQIPISDMLNYLDRYPLRLPARYSDRVACYTVVYITSNLAIDKQYVDVQYSKPEVWKAFLRRITEIVEFRPDGQRVKHDASEFV